MLDYCVKRAIVKIFKVSDSDNIYVTKQTCGFATTRLLILSLVVYICLFRNKLQKNTMKKRYSTKQNI